MNKGGIGLINPEIKVQTLRFKHLLKLVNNSDSIWADLALFNVESKIYNIFSAIKYNNTKPHTDEPSPFYKAILNDLKILQSRLLAPIRPDSDNKVLYEAFLQHYFSKIPPYSKSIYPIWDLFKVIPFSPETRQFLWKLARGIINTKDRLYRFQIVNQDTCPCCLRQIETLKHRLLECNLNAQIWIFLKATIPTLRSISFEDLIHLNLGNAFVQKSKYLYVVLGEAMLCMWNIRNDIIFRHKSMTPLIAKKTFLYRLRVRIKADHLRMSPAAFDDLWTLKSIPVTRDKTSNRLNIGF